MFKLLFIFIAICQAASATELRTHFDSLVIDRNAQDEFSLELKINADSTLALELKKIMNRLDELEDLNVADLPVSTSVDSLIEAAMEQLDLGQDGFFCYAFQGFDANDDYETGKCQQQVRALLRPFLAQKGIYRLKTVLIERNNYGDEISSYLLIETQKEVQVIYFDIVHEI